MLIRSDITNKGFKEKSENRGVTEFVYEQLSPGEQPLYTAEIVVKGEVTHLTVKKHKYRANTWVYGVIFDGTIDGPKSLGILFKWLGIE